MAVPLNTFFTYNQNYTYTKWDVIYGATASDTRYFYSTRNTNLGADPVSQFYYTPTSATRTDNVVRVSFTQTGTTYFQPGSVVNVSNLAPDPSVNYTGVILAAGAGYVDYLNPGLSVTNAISAGQVRAPIHPYWTTGFMWLPSWSTDATHNADVISSKLGEGYSQRQTTTINSNSLAWNLVFADRTDKEVSSLLNFLQNQGGATPFKLAFPVGLLYNTPSLKYISGPARHGMSSYGLNTLIVPVNQVWDIG